MGQKSCKACPESPYRIFNSTANNMTITFKFQETSELTVTIPPGQFFDFIAKRVVFAEVNKNKNIRTGQIVNGIPGTYMLTTDTLKFRDSKILERL